MENLLLQVFQWLHRHPELALQEYGTTEYLRKILLDRGVRLLDTGLETGLIAEIGTGRSPVVALRADLERNWAVVAEGIQTILRREGYPNPYETLKALTRTGAAIDEKVIADFIETLDVSESVKAELRAITPWSYTGF